MRIVRSYDDVLLAEEIERAQTDVTKALDHGEPFRSLQWYLVGLRTAAAMLESPAVAPRRPWRRRR